MLITLWLSDDSEQTVDVSSLRFSINGGPLELSMDPVTSRLQLHSPSDDDQRFQQLVVYHSAANALSIDVITHERCVDNP